LKILIVGLGSVGQRHAANLRTVCGNDLELTAYRVRGQQLVIGTDGSARPGDPLKEYRIAAFDDLEHALADGPDAVVVANPPAQHVPVALAAAEAGCHLLLEKPLGDSEEGVAELIEAVDRAGLACLVGYQLRFHPGFQRLVELLEQGAIGTVFAAHFEFGEHVADWHPWEDFRQGVAVGPGGGALLSQIHDLDLAYALFGLPERVSAAGGARSSLALDVEDTVDTLLQCGPVAVHVHQDILQRPPVRRYEVTGEGGKLAWDYLGGTLSHTRPDGSVESASYVEHERNRLFLDEVRHFLACVEGRERPLIDARDGVASLRIALAAAQSLANGGQPVVPKAA
jgi:predicted dehydrogenase